LRYGCAEAEHDPRFSAAGITRRRIVSSSPAQSAFKPDLKMRLIFGAFLLATPAGLEPATCGLEIRCSSS
jgi:hypothetical protein